MKIKKIVLVGMFSGLLAIISPLQIIIPFSPVPITLQVVGMVLAGGILGSRLGFLSVLIYTILGLVGLPIFAGFKSGLPALIGPTGGYIIGFIAAAYIIGKLVEVKAEPGLAYIIFANMIGLIVLYTIGTLQLSFIYTHSIYKALLAGVLPYIIPDLIKILFSSILTIQVRKVLIKSGYLVP